MDEELRIIFEDARSRAGSMASMNLLMAEIREARREVAEAEAHLKGLESVLSKEPPLKLGTTMREIAIDRSWKSDGETPEGHDGVYLKDTRQGEDK